MKEIIQNIAKAKISPQHFYKVIAVELFYCFIIAYCYQLFTLFIFGEGGNSFLYSKANVYIYFSLIIVYPICVNLSKISIYYKKDELSKAKDYSLVQMILILFDIVFVIFEWKEFVSMYNN
jgi:hypothetical protein